ncbi:hypothetical protein FO519_000682 [Halicephalobus sp. NKZ332]|nr:hypothetical protein FO519_000682 [Halicephalobus sp. NKZ332]
MSDDECVASDIEYEYYENESVESPPQAVKNDPADDPEYVEYTCFTPSQIISILNDEVHRMAQKIDGTEDEALYLLVNSNWDAEECIKNVTGKKDDFYVKCNLKTSMRKFQENIHSQSSSSFCQVCFKENNTNDMSQLQCGHSFCTECWMSYFCNVLKEGVTSRIECMNANCSVICLRGFVEDKLERHPSLLQLYRNKVLADCVLAHPYFTFCPGNDCNGIVYAKTKKAHRVTCSFCNHSFCVLCGMEYHAPCSCETLRKWRKKCGDDSETANYISAHTKDCPNCHSCIEKNGGCNHMQCAKCKYHFCWMCFKDWKTHGSEYYECSRYKENPEIAQEANYIKARRALEKYLHYYERFDNHSKSLKLEEDLRARIVKRIEEKVANREGTWIDWQYLHDAATLLTKCRYTLQYTYPFAYYLESQRDLFEYQQAQLEKEIEELSWKVERAETTDRADLERQMHVAECKRRTLLQDFLS